MNNRDNRQTPVRRMPAEWEPHQATWLSWPHNVESWPGKMESIYPAYAKMVAVLARSETVHINVDDDEMERVARGWLDTYKARGDIRFHHFPTNDAWCRDHGAIFIIEHPEQQEGHPPELVATNWGYNAWGGKYPPYDLDDAIPPKMAEVLGVRCIEGGMILEGGSIEVNGEGLLLTTEQCLLNPNRNPHLSREEIEARLCEVFGVERVLWLKDGIVGDDTDGHIDDIARFVAPDTVVTMVEENAEDENFMVLHENLVRLQEMTDQHGTPLKIVTLPMPPATFYEGERLPASYANFYIANHTILVPFFNHPNDIRAQEILQDLFPSRRVVGIDCTDIIWGFGAFHCLTQQVPEFPSKAIKPRSAAT